MPEGSLDILPKELVMGSSVRYGQLFLDLHRAVARSTSDQGLGIGEYAVSYPYGRRLHLP